MAKLPSIEESRTSNKMPSIEELREEAVQENPFAYGIDRVLLDDKLKQFVAQDIDENEKYKLANSLYVSNAYKVPFDEAYQKYDGVVNEMFKGKSISPKQVFEKIQWQEMSEKQRFDNYHSNTGAWQEFEDCLSSKCNRGKGMFAGLLELKTDIELGTLKKLGFPSDWLYTKQLNEWSVSMRDGVKQYMEENPGQFLNTPGTGFWDTTFNYIQHPEIIAAGVAEQVPLILASYLSAGTAGAVAKAAGATAKGIKIASFVAGTEAYAIPLNGERYSNL